MALSTEPAAEQRPGVPDVGLAVCLVLGAVIQQGEAHQRTDAA
jgi:hypothetical protein